MRVLHTYYSIEHSGAEVRLVQSAPLMKQHGFELHAMSTGDTRGHYAAIMESSGITVHHRPLAKSPQYFFDLIRFMRRWRFDVVHTHPERAFFWFQLAARIAGVPTIVHTVHNVFDFHGALRIERRAQRRIARSLGVRFVAPGASIAESERVNFGNPTVIVPNWTDADTFTPPANDDERWALRDALGLPRDALVFTSVGSCQPVKRHATIVRAIAEVAETLPNAWYLHVGGGPLEADEKDLASQLGIGDKAVFVGRSNDVPSLLKATDVFLMPSRYEGLPNACVEAMSSSLPVVATRVVGLKDLVVHERTGLLIDDPSQLVSALLLLGRDEAKRREMGEAGRRRVLREFSLERGVERLIEVYGFSATETAV
jgi:glycosyltransferase involved in cell wall biosynthesis